MRTRLLATISIGLLSAACQGTYSQSYPSAASATYGTAYQSANAACADYGFRPGTTGFDRCVANEQQARAAGRVSRDYAAANLTSDARYACTSYGLAAGTPSYDRCVGREVDARSWRAEANTATSYTDQYGQRVDAQGYRVDQYNNRVDAEDYRLDSSGRRITVQGPYAQGSQAYSSRAVSRDEFGNLYDVQGNRVDANGRIIAMRR